MDEIPPGEGRPCETGLPAECSEGTLRCLNGTFTCQPNPTSSVELCDGRDDDCNGVVDDNVSGAGGLCVTGQPGVCSAGTTVCSNGTSSCSQTNQPSAEVCDGQDNDCNGQVDDNPSGVGQSCDTGNLGVCSAGTTVCLGTILRCDQNLSSSPEVCDGLDNDCDGQVDEGLTFDADGDGHSTPSSCGGTKDDCNDNDATVHPGAAEVCDVKDNDCDGTVDDSPSGAGLGCATGLPGVCSAGITACANGAVSCTQTFLPSAEVCDGLDNDCNGTADNGFAVGTTCTVGVGACQNTGTLVCIADGSGTECNAVPGTPSAEICGDGIDQDCDGQDVDCITQAITLTDDLIADVQSLQIDKGTKNSLLAKLNAAKSSLEKGNTAAAEGQLTAFINEVSAQRGKKIPAAEADALIAQARAIIAILP